MGTFDDACGGHTCENYAVNLLELALVAEGH
jgi:hypothetical protein